MRNKKPSVNEQFVQTLIRELDKAARRGWQLAFQVSAVVPQYPRPRAAVSQTSTYRYRDVEKRRVYMRDWMRRKRAKGRAE